MAFGKEYGQEMNDYYGDLYGWDDEPLVKPGDNFKSKKTDMARNYSYGGYANERSGFSRSPYRQGFDDGRPRGRYVPYGGSAPKKRTGAKRGIQKFGNVNKGKEYITGWRVSRGTLFTYYCYPYRGKNSKTHELFNKTTGEMIGYNWLCKVTNKRTHRSTVHSCLVNAQMTKAVIKDLELVINTNAPNGGYCGTYVRRKR